MILGTLALLALGFACAGGLVIWRRRALPPEHLYPHLPRTGIALTALGVICFAVVILVSRQSHVHGIPTGTSLGLAAAVTLAIAGTLCGPQPRLIRFLWAGLVICVPLAYGILQQKNYATVLSVDPWGHELLTNAIVRNGHVPSQATFGSDVFPLREIRPYARLPGFHVLTGMGQIMTGLDYSTTALVVPGLCTLAVAGAAIGTVATRFLPRAAGMAGLFLFTTSDNVLDETTKNIVPNGIAGAMVVLVLVLAWRWRADLGPRAAGVLLLLSLFVLTTHSISFAVLMVSSLAVLLSQFAEPSRRTARVKLAWTFLVLPLGGLFYWGTVSGSYLASAALLVQETVRTGLSESGYLARIPVSFSEVLLSRAGMIAYFGLVGISMTWLVVRRSWRPWTAFLCIEAGMLAVSLVAFLSTSLFPIAHRFWFFAEIVGGPFIALIIILVIPRRPVAHRLFLATVAPLVFLLVAAMVLSPIANNDHPLTSAYTIRTGLYDEELQAVRFAAAQHDGRMVWSDFYLISRAVYVGLGDESAGYLSHANTTQIPSGIALTRPDSWSERYVIFGTRYHQTSETQDSVAVAQIERAWNEHSAKIYDARATNAFSG